MTIVMLDRIISQLRMEQDVCRVLKPTISDTLQMSAFYQVYPRTCFVLSVRKAMFMCHDG